MMIPPRYIRLKDAYKYLGMDPNRFNREVRPFLTEIPIGSHGIAFDRLDLESWADDYKDRNGRPGKQKGGDKPWDERTQGVSSTVRASGTSIRLSEEDEFAKVLEKVTSVKQKSS